MFSHSLSDRQSPSEWASVDLCSIWTGAALSEDAITDLLNAEKFRAEASETIKSRKLSKDCKSDRSDSLDMQILLSPPVIPIPWALAASDTAVKEYFW